MDRADLAIKMSKLVHDRCTNVPHDIGLQLLYLIEEYEGAFHQPPVSGRSEQLSDSLEQQIKRENLDPYSPHAKWIKP